MAKTVCIYQSWSLLCCGNSFSRSLCFHLPYWRHGRSPSLISCSLSLSESEISMFSDSNFFFCPYFSIVIHYQGLWMGIICGLVVQVVALVAINACTDWDREVNSFILP